MAKSSSIHVRQIVASVDDEAAGPSYSVLALSTALRSQGVHSSVMALGRRPSEPGLEVFGQDFAGIPVVQRLAFSCELTAAIDAAAVRGELLHTHGLWLMPNISPAWAARRRGVPLIVSPRGMLGEAALSFSATRKKIVWSIAQRRALRTAACFHATSNTEAEDIRRIGLTAPVAIIPNGIDISRQYAKPKARTVLHLGRLHPKKGIDRLIAAWARLADRHVEWRLRIVGPSQVGYRDALERQVAELGVPRVDFHDPLIGDPKWEAYAQAGVFVLPTLHENFGMVVAEALAAGVPVISTKGAPWQGLEVERCGWWIDHGIDPLAVALDTALSQPDSERVAMGERGRKWMLRDFGWDGIASRMNGVYRWVLGGGRAPACIQMD